MKKKVNRNKKIIITNIFKATLALNAINNVPIKRPWTLSFSYGRALQVTVIKVWAGKDENIAAAQAALMVKCFFFWIKGNLNKIHFFL